MKLLSSYGLRNLIAKLLQFINTKQDKIKTSNKLSADLVSDIQTTNKFVKLQDINTWNTKTSLIDNIITRLAAVEQYKFTAGTKHIFMTQQEYDLLTSYEDNAIYFIIESNSNYSVFGGTFPFVLAGEGSRFGDSFPLILS